MLLSKRLQAAFIFVVTAIAFILLISCGDDGAENALAKDEPEAKATDSMVVELQGSTGLTVLEVTMTTHKLDLVNSAQGVFVRAIDNTAAGGGYFWIYSVNDTLAGLAADKYITNDGDAVKWHYRRF